MAFCADITTKQLYYAIGAFLTICTVGLGISVAVIASNGYNVITSGSKSCPVFPNITYFTADKQIFKQWHWTYEFNEFDGSIQQMCPTTQHDSVIYLNGEPVVRSDGKILTVVSKMNVMDCNKNIIFVVRTGNAFETLVNGNKIWVSFELRDQNKGEILAYSETTSFFTDDIRIKDIYGSTVAKLYRNKLTLSKWQWEINIYNINHPAADKRLLSIIAGKQSFDEGKETDICNQYVLGVGIVVIILVAVGIGLIIFFAIKAYKEHYFTCFQQQSNTNIIV